MKFHDMSKEQLYSFQTELNKEIQQRSQEELKEKNRKRSLQNDVAIKNIDSLLAITLEHDRNSCSDKSPVNNDGECVRCSLLDFKASNWIDSIYKVKVIIQSDPIERPKK